MKRFASAFVASVVLATPFLSGCAAGGTVITCTGKANNVHQSSGTRTAMDGKATGQCNAAVSINGFVEIQKKSSSGSWYSYKRTAFSLVTTPGKKFTRQAATKCAKGTFRTYSYVVGTYKGVSETRRNTSGETRNPCS